MLNLKVNSIARNVYLNCCLSWIRLLILCVVFLINIIATAEGYEDSDLTSSGDDESINIQASVPESTTLSLDKLVNTLKYPKYQVEIIVFSHLHSKSVIPNKESFPDSPGKLNKKNSVEFNNAKMQFLLKEYNLLKNRSNYKIILQAASQYDLLPSQKNKKFLIQSNSNQEISEKELNELENFIATLTITPIRNNTFNLAFDGIFSKFRLTKAAKIKPKEIYYFDHPMFGVLITMFEVKMGSASL